MVQTFPAFALAASIVFCWGVQADAFATRALSVTSLKSYKPRGTQKHRIVPDGTLSPRLPYSACPRKIPGHLFKRKSQSLSSSSSTALGAFAAVASAVDGFYRASPLLAAFLTCGTNASAADLVAQTRASTAVEAGPGAAKLRSPIEKRRTLAFLLYGGLYQGVAQEFLYNRFLPKLFGAGSSPTAVVGKVLFDMLVLTPFLCLPSAYMVKSLVYRRTILDAWRRYAHDVRKEGLLTKFWGLWGPVQCITFGIVPEHFRVSFVSSVSFFWLIVLSTISSGKTN